MLMIHPYEVFCVDCSPDVISEMEKLGFGDCFADPVETLCPVKCGKCRKLMFPGEKRTA